MQQSPHPDGGDEDGGSDGDDVDGDIAMMVVMMTSEVFGARLNRFGFEILVKNAKRRFW